jgi:hypothetical protein
MAWTQPNGEYGTNLPPFLHSYIGEVASQAFNRHGGRLRLLSRSRREEALEEATQEGFAEVLELLKEHKELLDDLQSVDSAKYEEALRQINRAIWRGLTKVKRFAKRSGRELKAEANLVDHASELQRLVKEIWEEAHQIDARAFPIFRAYYMERKTMQVIGDEFGMNRNEVSVVLGSMRERLKQILSDGEYQPAN